MRLAVAPRPRAGSLARSGLSAVVALVLGVLVVEALNENELWSNYKPVAMDESWSVNGAKPSYSNGIEKNWQSGPPRDLLLSRPSAYQVPEPAPMPLPDPMPMPIPEPMPMPNPPAPAPMPDPMPMPDPVPAPSPSDGVSVLDVEQWRGESVQDKLFRVPSTETSTLTKLIAGGQTPTFVDKVAKYPDMPLDGQTRQDRVLARYKFIVPIYIPAIKLKKKPTMPPAPVRFTTEQVTEYVPVKQVGTRVKEVIKAERVPQQLITDYVQEPDGRSVPSRVDDKVYPSEHVVSSVVQNYD